MNRRKETNRPKQSYLLNPDSPTRDKYTHPWCRFYQTAPASCIQGEFRSPQYDRPAFPEWHAFCIVIRSTSTCNWSRSPYQCCLWSSLRISSRSIGVHINPNTLKTHLRADVKIANFVDIQFIISQRSDTLEESGHNLFCQYLWHGIHAHRSQ